MTAILLLAIPCFTYGMGIFPTTSLIALAIASWMVIAIRTIGILALIGTAKQATACAPHIIPYVWTMHGVSIAALICLFQAGMMVTFGFMLVTSIVTLLIFLKSNYGTKTVQD